MIIRKHLENYDIIIDFSNDNNSALFKFKQQKVTQEMMESLKYLSNF